MTLTYLHGVDAMSVFWLTDAQKWYGSAPIIKYHGYRWYDYHLS